MPTIHPTSVVETGAELAKDVTVGPLCYVGSKVIIGQGTRLISHVSIVGRTTLGQYNVIWPHATLGADPQDLKYKGEDSLLHIGDHNQIHENVTIHKGSAAGGNLTRLGDHNLLMAGAHVAHDCILANHIILANAVLLAGHVQIGDRVVVSGGSAMHHFVSIGELAFIGGMTRVVHDVPPYLVFEGIPGDIRAINVIGLERAGIETEQIDRLKTAYRILFRKAGTAPQTMTERIDQLLSLYPADLCVQKLTDFITRSSKGIFGRQMEAHRTDQRRRKPRSI